MLVQFHRDHSASLDIRCNYRKSTVAKCKAHENHWLAHVTYKTERKWDRPTLTAMIFSLIPPTGRTFPVNETSPVIARFCLTGTPVASDNKAVTMVQPALGPSFGVAPCIVKSAAEDRSLRILIMVLTPPIQIQFIELVARRLKIKKAKQTIMHCTTKQYNTRQGMKCNEMNKMKQGQWYRPIGILWGHDKWKICNS